MISAQSLQIEISLVMWSDYVNDLLTACMRGEIDD